MTLNKISFLLLFFCCYNFQLAQAQKKKKTRIEQSPVQELQYSNKEYINSIKSVQVFPVGKENQFPIYTLGSNDELIFSFDDLRGDTRSFYYSIEHCNADWTPSRVSILDYAAGYNEDRIMSSYQSIGTLQKYTHYEFRFPTEQVKPKIAGNFLLKIYEDADKERLIITRKIYVLRSLVSASTTIQASQFADKRNFQQKLNVNLKTGLTISNPHRDLQLHVFQNQRPDNLQILTAPMFIGAGEIRYNNSETLDFLANNEFRFVDLRSIKGSSNQISAIEIDTLTEAILFTDKNLKNQTYGNVYDENGKFYIRNLDYDNENITGDYIQTVFSLDHEANVNGTIHIVGGFNNFNANDQSKLTYNEETKKWEISLFLKQGLYDYEYVLKAPNGKISTDAFSGSHFATGNDYQIFVYCRRTGTYWDELIGVDFISINNKQNNN